ncbi:MAG TPA: glycosyltransferase [Gemmatimonadaceae bacterium]
MIVVCEPVCWGWEHVAINAALIEIVRLAFPSSRIAFYGEASHIAHLQSEVGEAISSSIVWTPVRLAPRRAAPSSRWAIDVALALRLLNVLRSLPEGRLLLCGATPAMVLSIKLMLRLGARRANGVQIICHGWLSRLRGWRSRNPFLRILDWRSALTIGNDPRIQFVVLEESIRNTLVTEFPRLARHLAVLQHPIPPSEPFAADFHVRAPFRFGFLGLASDAKGFPAFLEMASALRERFGERVEFHAVGTVPPGSAAPSMEALTVKAGLVKASRADFSQAIRELHYVCLPYHGRHYELSPSGVLMDAIAFGKPILAAGIPLVKELFDRYGDIGFICTDTRDFCDTITEIVNHADEAHYHAQVNALRAARDSRTPSALAGDYRRITNQRESISGTGAGV